MGVINVYEIALLSVFPGIMIFAGAMDLFTMTIPNKISLVLIAAFLLMAPFVGMGWYQFAMHLSAGMVFLLVGFAMFAAGLLGGGDAKILAVAGLWLGFDHIAEYTLYAAILGGIVTFGLLFMRKIPVPLWMIHQDWFSRLYYYKTGVPYGIALAGAALMVYPQTLWLAAIG